MPHQLDIDAPSLGSVISPFFLITVTHPIKDIISPHIYIHYPTAHWAVWAWMGTGEIAFSFRIVPRSNEAGMRHSCPRDRHLTSSSDGRECSIPQAATFPLEKGAGWSFWYQMSIPRFEPGTSVMQGGHSTARPPVMKLIAPLNHDCIQWFSNTFSGIGVTVVTYSGKLLSMNVEGRLNKNTPLLEFTLV